MKSLSIHLTDQCNNSCNFCVVNSYQGCREKVNRKVIYNFLKANADKGYEAVNIHGGEPTIIPEFMDVLNIINEFKYPTVILQTNARRLKDMDFAKEITSKGVGLCVVSLHGHDAETHDYSTKVEESFVEAVEGIKNVKALGKKVRTNTVVCNKNKNHILDTVKLSVSLGVDHINISAIHPTGKAFENFNEVTPKLSEIIPEVKKAVDYVVSQGRVCTLEGFPYCLLGDYSKYMIDWDNNNFKLLFRTTVLENYDDFMRNEARKLGSQCKECIKKEKCGGVYKEYLMFNGWDEFTAIKEKEVIGQ